MQNTIILNTTYTETSFCVLLWEILLAAYCLKQNAIFITSIRSPPRPCLFATFAMQGTYTFQMRLNVTCIFGEFLSQ